MENPEEVTGKTLDLARTLEGLSQGELADRLFATQTQVSRWIRGVHGVPRMVAHIMSCARCYQHYIREGAASGHSQQEEEREVETGR